MENNNNENNPQQRDPGQPITPPLVPAIIPEQFKQQQLQKFEYNEEYLNALIAKYKGLTVKGVDDKEGLKVVHDARIDIRNHRTAITKTGTDLRIFSNEYNKAILNRVSDLTSIISPREEELQEIEDRIAEEKEKIRADKEREESGRIMARITELSNVGAAFDFHELKGMSDDHYAQILEDATTAHNAKLAQDEKDREIAYEKARKEKEEREAETARLEKQREEQEAERKKLEIARMAFEKEQEIIRQENLAKEKVMREEQEKIEKDKQALQTQKNTGRHNQLIGRKLHLNPQQNSYIWNSPDGRDDNLVIDQALLMELPDDEFEKVLAGAVEFIRQGTERYQVRLDEKKKEEEARVQKEKDAAVAKALKDQEEARLKAEGEENERLMQGDDAYRFSAIAQQVKVSFLDSAVWSAMRSEKGKKIGYEIKALLQSAFDICKENARKEPPADL